MTPQEILTDNACIDCLSTGEKETITAAGAAAAVNLDQGQITAITQVAVTVTGVSGVLLAAPAAGSVRKFVTLQNQGVVAVIVRTSAGASATAANGEWILSGGDIALDGKGGFLTLDGYSGGLWAITPSSTALVSVAYADV